MIHFETKSGTVSGQLSVIGETEVEKIKWSISSHFDLFPRDVLVFATCNEYATIEDPTPRKFEILI